MNDISYTVHLYDIENNFILQKINIEVICYLDLDFPPPKKDLSCIILDIFLNFSESCCSEMLNRNDYNYFKRFCENSKHNT